MNFKYILPIAAMAAVATLTGCDENSWNDKLDGFTSEFNPTQEATMEYTLVAADYKGIASNKANKAAAEAAGLGDLLQSVSKKNCFPAQLNASEYIPNYLNTDESPVFYYTDGSSVKLTYNVEAGLPESVYAAAAASTYDVTEADYIATWESDKDFISAFAPSHPASKALPGILASALPDAQAGDFVIVNYKETEQEPIFGTIGGGDTPDQPGFEMSDMISTIVPDDEVELYGVVSGVCTQGFTVSDKSATIFVYMGGGYDPTTYPVGSQICLIGTAASYNNSLQIGKGAEITVLGTQEVNYPTAVNYDGAALDAVLTREANLPAVYCTMTAKAVISGNYFNLELEGATTAKGSIYGVTEEYKAMLTDGETYKVTGWFVSIAGGRFCNIVLTGLESASGAKVASRAAVVEVPTQATSAIYSYNGSSWSVPANFRVLTHADYQAMGQKYDNLTAPADYLPTYLKQTYPYAQAEDVKYIVYKLYKSGSTSTVCDMYTFDGANWVINTGITTETAQYVRNNGKWIYDPNVTITLPAGKNQELSTLYYQECVNWVFENICKPLGDTDIKSGKFYVTSYGNNEYYSGTSAYQGNVDLRAGSARTQYAAGYEGMTDEEVIATMKNRFTHEVLPAVLSKLHADAAPLAGMDVYYTVNFASYDGSKTNQHVVKYKVVGPGQFEFVECDWDN